MLFLSNLNRVMQIVYKQYKIVVMMEIRQSLKSGKRFSLSLDEYSLLKHKKYLNINVHQDRDKF